MTAPALASIRSARVVITRNCLERLAEAEGAPEEPIVLQARLMAAFRHCTFSEDSPERDFAAIEFSAARCG
jgi:hypothetical protein